MHFFARRILGAYRFPVFNEKDRLEPIVDTKAPAQLETLPESVVETTDVIPSETQQGT